MLGLVTTLGDGLRGGVRDAVFYHPPLCHHSPLGCFVISWFMVSDFLVFVWGEGELVTLLCFSSFFKVSSTFATRRRLKIEHHRSADGDWDMPCPGREKNLRRGGENPPTFSISNEVDSCVANPRSLMNSVGGRHPFSRWLGAGLNVSQSYSATTLSFQKKGEGPIISVGTSRGNSSFGSWKDFWEKIRGGGRFFFWGVLRNKSGDCR